jgi:nitroreductase/ketosteroid isomerase-like protein
MLILFLSGFTAHDIQQTADYPGLSLKETFDLYVQSVQKADLETLFSTVTSSDKLIFLTSRGKLINSREEYYKFHQDWFREKDWEMPVELLEVHEGKEYGYATAIFRYRGKNPEGNWNNLDAYFTLIFHREDEKWKVVADICTPINRYASDENQNVTYTSEQTYLLDIIKNRRTVRKFRPTPVPKEHILKILDAARYAPTSGNQQPWKFLVVQDRQKLDLLRDEARKWYLDAFKEWKNPSPAELDKINSRLKDILKNVMSAPVYVAVLVDSKSQYPDYNIYDGTLAAGYLMIAARSLGYGTGFFTTYFPSDKMKAFFEIPDQYRLICFTPIGVPHEWPKMPFKKNIEDLIIFERF